MAIIIGVKSHQAAGYNIVQTIGGQGIFYEYKVPYGINPEYYYMAAKSVRSKKGYNERPSVSKDHYGKVYPVMSYQPIGHPRYFTFYQLKNMKKAALQKQQPKFGGPVNLPKRFKFKVVKGK